ncbi:MAG: DUF3579 domain-containing protein [Casimicrobiaceae bacterium]
MNRPPSRDPEISGHEHSDLVLWGVTTSARRFRPGDWAERLAGLTASFGHDQKLVYSPLVRPVSVGALKALIVGRELASLAPRLHRFYLDFAHDNALQTAFVAGALKAPQTLVAPPSAMRDEPREPV